MVNQPPGIKKWLNAFVLLVAAELLTTNKLSELACLALYLMYEKKQGKDSFWYPYIRELDRQRGRGQLSVESPLLWSPQEVNEYFHGSPMKVEISFVHELRKSLQILSPHRNPMFRFGNVSLCLMQS